ncbi:MAG: heavy-metal-associated domain-containing protein [Flavipsychrobacter sp.]
MKRFIAFLITILFSTQIFAQNKDIVTEHYQVNGVCEQCKKRIEDAAYIKGVKHAEWDVKTHDLTVVYRPSKTSAEEILKSVAKAGHDNEKVQATDKDYKDLPSCCYYRTVSKK